MTEQSRHGQTMVEFALLLPMLLVLLLGVADFGRVFQSGISAEAAARNAAEATAQEYLRTGPGNPPRLQNEPAPAFGDADYNGATYYRELHDLAARTACREARILPNTTYTPDNPLTLGVDEETCRSADEATAPSMPVIMTCVHDEVDPFCGDVAYGVPIPGSCMEMQDPPDPGQDTSDGSRYVEVRVCYRFTTLLNLRDLQLPLGWSLSIGDIWLERANTFAVGYYPPPPPPSPPPPPPPPSSEPCSAPIASFTSDTSSGTSPLEVQFTDTSTEVDCPILTWSWDFGDGSPVSTAADPLHTFAYGGPDPSAEYTVTLTVTSGAGSHQTTQVISVGSGLPPCAEPIASFTTDTSSGTSPLEVQFTDTSTEVDCPILTWSWDFGDGSPVSTEADPPHTFTYGGPAPSVDYTVTLTVTSDAGSDEGTQVITVVAAAP